MTNNKESILWIYENFLLGKSNNITLKTPFEIEEEPEGNDEAAKEARADRNKRIGESKEKDALIIVRYAIADMLCWTPQDAMESITWEVVKQLGLDKLLERHIQYPKDLSKKQDLDWMVHLAFPYETRYDVKERILRLYQRVKSGNPQRFPKCTFHGPNGPEKFAFLLNDYIASNLAAKDIAELYAIFGDSARGNKLMGEAKLYYAYRELYESPLEALHESLGSNRDDFLFNYYQYKAAANEVKRLKKRIDGAKKP